MRIALSGKKCSGKSTIANYLLNRGFTRIFFAQKVYETDQEVCNFFLDQGWMPPEDFDIHAKRREYLQFLGMLGRRLDSMLWINNTLEINDFPDRVVLDDLRFDNELIALIRKGFILIRIECDEDIRRERELRLYGKVSGDDNESEHGITRFDLFDYTWKNNNNTDLIDICSKLDDLGDMVK